MSILYPQFYIFYFALFWIFLIRRSDKNKMLFISMFFMIFALSRPVLLDQENQETLNAKEIIIALDVSYSMRADDIKPSRLERSKELIREILKENKNDKFSLFAFTTNPLILTPATTDHKLLIAALDSLKVDNILTHGTDFKTLLRRINKIKTVEKNLLVFSDGGDLEDIEIPDDIHLFAVGMATKKGATLFDSYGKKLKNSDGNLVISKLNPKFKELANKSGGKYLTYEDIDLSLDFIKQSEFAKKKRKGYSELYKIALFIALLLLFFHFVRIPKKLLLLSPLISMDSSAFLLDWYYIKEANLDYDRGSYIKAAQNFEKVEHKTMQSELNRANSYYQSGAYKDAKSIYKTLKSTDPKYKKIIFFKLGNCSAKLKEYDKAKEYYKKALMFGKDSDIEYNLKLIEKRYAKKRKDIPAFKKSDKERDDKQTQQNKNHNKNRKSATKKLTKTGMGTKSQGSSSKKKSDTKNSNNSKLTRPLGYKAYELINRGYIDEKTPW